MIRDIGFNFVTLRTKLDDMKPYRNNKLSSYLFHRGVAIYIICSICSWNLNPERWNIFSFIVLIIAIPYFLIQFYGSSKKQLIEHDKDVYENYEIYQKYGELLENFDNSCKTTQRTPDHARYEFSNDLFECTINFTCIVKNRLDVWLSFNHYVWGYASEKICFSSNEDVIQILAQIGEIIVKAKFSKEFYGPYSISMYPSSLPGMVERYGQEACARMDEEHEKKMMKAINILKSKGIPDTEIFLPDDFEDGFINPLGSFLGGRL